MIRYLLPIALIFAVSSVCQDAGAQLFGPRVLGQSLSRQPSPGLAAAEEVGELRGTERFIRGNRGIRDFVGTDAADTPLFIGIQQGRSRGTIRSAITNLRPPREPNVNQPQPQQPGPNLPYAPRLQLGFTPPEIAPSVVALDITERLVDALALQRSDLQADEIGVILQGRTAILVGEVASEHERLLAQQLTMLEAGVSEVQNELTIAGELSAEELPPAEAFDTLPNLPDDMFPTPGVDR